VEKDADASQKDDLDRIRHWFAGSPVEIRYAPDKERFLVASRDIEAGETVLLSHPYAFTVTEQEKSRVCSHCLRVCPDHSGSLAFSCRECEEVWYCCSACQEQHRPQHRFECSSLKAFLREADWASTENRTEVRLVFRILSRRAFELTSLERNNAAHPPAQDRRFDDFLVLNTYRQRWSRESIEMFEEVVPYLQRLDPWLAAQDSNLLVDTFLRFRINGCALWTTTAEIGQGIYLEASLLNHSCQPTLGDFRADNSASLRFLAIEPIAKGEELTICYFDAGDLDSRRDYLRNTYLFECQCVRCREEERGGLDGYLAWRSRVGCPIPWCKGILLYGTTNVRQERVCNQCGFTLRPS
jgi:SET and MYND domain-containing protein